MPAAYAANVVPFAQLSGVDLRIYARHRPPTTARLALMRRRLLVLELLEARLKVVHHPDVPESPGRIDTALVGDPRVFSATESVEARAAPGGRRRRP